MAAKYDQNALIKKFFGADNFVYINPSFVWDLKNETTTISFVVHSATDTMINSAETELPEIFNQVPKYRGGQVYINVEKNIPIADPALINFNGNKNQLNTNLPKQDLFSYLNRLSFSIDDNNEIYKDSDLGVEKFYNDGRIAVISSLITDTAWYNYKSTFYRLNSDSVRLMEPGFHLAIDGGMFYAEFRNTSGEVGLPYIVDLYDANIIVDQTYFKTFIDQLALILNAGQQKDIYPSKIIKLDDRLRDSTGYYFKYIEFSSGVDTTHFLNNQLRYLAEMLNDLPEITDSTSIVDYARTQWL